MVVGFIAPVILDKVSSKKKEKFENNGESCTTKNVLNFLWGIVNVLVGVYAIYLSFQRNSGFNLGSMLAACCCSWCYVAYALAVPVQNPFNI